MPKMMFEGPNPSFSHNGRRFLRGEDPANNADGSYNVESEEDAEYLISTRKFSYATEATTQKKGRVTIGGRGKSKPVPGQDAEPPKTVGGAPEFPANGFQNKRDLQAFAREHLEYEADLNKALKTLNAQALAAYTEKFVKPAEAANEERPSDLGLDDDDGEIDTARNIVTVGEGGGDLDEE